MTQSKKRVLLISSDPSEMEEIKQILEENGTPFMLYTAESPLLAFDTIYSDPPDLIIIDQSLDEGGWKDLCKRIKTDTIFSHLPIVLILQPTTNGTNVDWKDIPIDDYFLRPLISDEVLLRVSLIFARTARVRDANPLTRLPGNYSIMREMQARIDNKSAFSVGYVDLDYFKSFNDKYGFLRGDEIIKMIARLLTNSLRSLKSSEVFVGHIGGDDFVFIVPPERLDIVCKEIIKNFDLIVGNFYDEEDRIRGYIESKNRQGNPEKFPVVSVSIAVVSNEYRPIRHIGQVSAIAAEIKKRVKSMKGSNYLKDTRRFKP